MQVVQLQTNFLQQKPTFEKGLHVKYAFQQFNELDQIVKNFGENKTKKRKFDITFNRKGLRNFDLLLLYT